jgi:hypothetical protein
MKHAPNNNIHAICQIIAQGCRAEVTRLCAILHTMDEESLEAARDAAARVLVSLDSDLRGLEKWLAIAVGQETEDPPRVQGLREAGAAAVFYTAPERSKRDRPPGESPAIVVHPPPDWAQAQIPSQAERQGQ